ncbi:prolipoprotein diacylglyceryl transferase [Striga asiatica]|uniref:Prolipoprotein diacylglyceryl transferase n=1 Tax=Striga asiatica TaxID=4170 RepID=A0A5A7RMQ0_STRAF|nr:prolipoprotein diacylglyceryl transferase [Striga asiatica]
MFGSVRSLACGGIRFKIDELSRTNWSVKDTKDSQSFGKCGYYYPSPIFLELMPFLWSLACGGIRFKIDELSRTNWSVKDTKDSQSFGKCGYYYPSPIFLELMPFLWFDDDTF